MRSTRGSTSDDGDHRQAPTTHVQAQGLPRSSVAVTGRQSIVSKTILA
jgi:hypothetical protein